MFVEVPATRNLAGHDSTDLAWREADVSIMDFMMEMLFQCPTAGRRWIGSGHQVIVSQPDRLRAASELTVVGFFGHMRLAAAATTLPQVQAVDEALIASFPDYPGIFSYSSLQLPAGDWGNLAVFADRTAMDAWNRNPIHVKAIHELAPLHYEWVRIHVARATGLELSILYTSFFEFEPGCTWRGICRYESGFPVSRHRG